MGKWDSGSRTLLHTRSQELYQNFQNWATSGTCKGISENLNKVAIACIAQFLLAPFFFEYERERVTARCPYPNYIQNFLGCSKAGPKSQVFPAWPMRAVWSHSHFSWSEPPTSAPTSPLASRVHHWTHSTVSGTWKAFDKYVRNEWIISSLRLNKERNFTKNHMVLAQDLHLFIM